MASTFTLYGRREYLPTQYREAAGLVFQVAAVEYGGRLATALMMAEKPYDYYLKLDGRSAEAKELQQAEKAMWDAISRYDTAREAVKAKLKGIK